AIAMTAQGHAVLIELSQVRRHGAYSRRARQLRTTMERVPPLATPKAEPAMARAPRPPRDDGGPPRARAPWARGAGGRPSTAAWHPRGRPRPAGRAPGGTVARGRATSLRRPAWP